MNVYEITFDGMWLGGKSIVIAESEARALAMVKFDLTERKISTNGIQVVRSAPHDKEQIVYLDSGDY
jgi:hypothetical protein